MMIWITTHKGVDSAYIPDNIWHLMVKVVHFVLYLIACNAIKKQQQMEKLIKQMILILGLMKPPLKPNANYVPPIIY